MKSQATHGPPAVSRSEERARAERRQDPNVDVSESIALLVRLGDDMLYLDKTITCTLYLRCEICSFKPIVLYYSKPSSFTLLRV